MPNVLFFWKKNLRKRRKIIFSHQFFGSIPKFDNSITKKKKILFVSQRTRIIHRFRRGRFVCKSLPYGIYKQRGLCPLGLYLFHHPSLILSIPWRWPTRNQFLTSLTVQLSKSEFLRCLLAYHSFSSISHNIWVQVLRRVLDVELCHTVFSPLYSRRISRCFLFRYFPDQDTHAHVVPLLGIVRITPIPLYILHSSSLHPLLTNSYYTPWPMNTDPNP